MFWCAQPCAKSWNNLGYEICILNSMHFPCVYEYKIQENGTEKSVS
jgi:hypothetical protein